jgi:RHS repeat-associated protein
VQYIYNGAGNRVAKIVNGVRMNYVNDPNRQYIQVLAETDSSGTPQRVYEWGNELINQETGTGANRHYYLQHAKKGSVRRLIDVGGAVVNNYEYDAFGTPILKAESVHNDYKFQGEIEEAETGLVFLRARHMDPDTGRFLTRDHLRGITKNPKSLHSYVYASGDPINAHDASECV